MRFSPIFFILLLISTHDGFSQKKEEEILQSIRNSSPEKQDTLYYELFRMFRTNDAGKALNYASKAYDLAKQFNHAMLTVKSCNALGYIKYEANIFNESEKYYQEGLAISESHQFDERTMYILNNLGILHDKFDNYGTAIKYYLRSLILAEKLNDYEQQAFLYNNIGLVYYRLHNLSDAIKNYETCVKIKKAHNITNGLEKNMVNIGLALVQQGFNAEAIKDFQQVISDCVKCDPSILVDCYMGMAEAYLNQKDIDNSNKYYGLARKLSDENNLPRTVASSDKNLAKILFLKGEYKSAEQLLQKAINHSIQAHSLANLQDCYDLMSALYEKTNDFRDALIYKNLFVKVKDSIINENMMNTMKNSFVEFHESKSNTILQKQEKNLADSFYLNLMLMGLTILACLLIFFIYRNLQTKVEKANTLEHMVEIKTKELKDSNFELIKSKEEYDHFLYKTSHDIRAPIASLQGLTNLALRDDKLKKDEHALEYFERIQKLTHELDTKLSRILVISKIHSHKTSLSPISINDMVAVIQKDLNQKFTYGPLITVTVSPESNIVADVEMMSIVMTSVLTNSFQYFDPIADNKTIQVDMKVKKGNYEIEVIDNGKGIVVEMVPKIFQLFSTIGTEQRGGPGIGLHLARLATEKMNGTITLMNNSRPTIFRISLPTED